MKISIDTKFNIGQLVNITPNVQACEADQRPIVAQITGIRIDATELGREIRYFLTGCNGEGPEGEYCLSETVLEPID